MSSSTSSEANTSVPAAVSYTGDTSFDPPTHYLDGLRELDRECMEVLQDGDDSTSEATIQKNRRRGISPAYQLNELETALSITVAYTVTP